MKIVLYDQALEYAGRLWRYRWLSVGIAWLVCVIGWPVVSMIPPKYESTARVYVNADQLLTPLLHGLAATVDPAQQVEFLQRTLLSRPNLEQVIHLSDLDISAGSKISDSDREDLLRQLARQVEIKPQTKNLFAITYDNPKPAVARNVVQALLTVFAENSVGGNRTEMENAKRFLDQQIQTYESQLRAAEQRRAEFHQKYIDLLPGLDGAVSRLEAGREAVAKLDLDANDARARRDALRRELASVPQFLSVDAVGPQVIVANRATNPRERLDEARGKLEELQSRFTDQHPDVIALKQRIATLEREAVSSLAGGSGGRKTQIANPLYDQVKVRLVEGESSLASIERRLAFAKQEQATLEEKAKATPGIQAQAQDLDRDYTVKKKNFEELLARREQTRIGEAADTTADKIQFRIIDPPQVPVIPAAPNQPMMLSAVFLAALAAAIGLPLLLLQFDQSFSNISALRAIGVPVLGSVSWISSADGHRRDRLNIAALCGCATVLVAVYGVLLVVSASLYRLSLI